MGFGEFLRTRLFEPLGMRDTAFWVPSDKTERFASCYQPETGGRGLKLQDDGRESIYYANPPRLELGGTGLIWTLPSSARSTRSICRPTWTSLRKVRYRRIFTRRRNPASRSRLGATFERRMHWGGDVGPLRASCPPPVRKR